MVTTSGQRWLQAAVIAVCFVTFAPAAVRAQSSIGFTGGGSIDPEQFYAGVYWESPALGGSFRLRPGLDGGFGDNLKLGTFNIDLIVKFPLGQTGWSLVQGGGPVISITRFTGEFEDYEQELHAGGSYLFGFQHDKGFFTEFRVGGGGYTPQLKMGVGWAVEIK
jgi:hypothetical protein